MEERVSALAILEAPTAPWLALTPPWLPSRQAGRRAGRLLRIAPVTRAGARAEDEGADLVPRAQAGDEAAFSELVRLHSPSVHRVAAGLVGADEAEDVTQETFLRALEGIARFEGRAAVRSWLCGIASRVALQRLRKKRRWSWLTRLGDRDPHAPPARGEGTLESSERQAAIEAALARLPDHQRTVVVLRIYEGLSYEEIASALGIRRPTAESRMARARVALREELGPWLEGAE
ncbi:MAG: RNA polymerase sigma factor [Planctomycetota bacterium]